MSLTCVLGDITRETTDVIVNSANQSLFAGSGVCGAIHRAAGRELEKECLRIRNTQLNDGFLPTGEAILTNGYNLHAKKVIHAVGPVYVDGTKNEAELLKKTYESALTLAEIHGFTSISFPSISTGIYRFPVETAAEIAINTIKEFLSHAKHVKDVRMVLFTQQDFVLYHQKNLSL
jgi:O-acetyl-ADP-ribose deacetylase (regulator of RNase III)